MLLTTRFIWSVFILIFAFAVWMRSYRLVDLFCRTGKDGNSWIISTSRGALSVSKYTVHNQDVFSMSPLQQGHIETSIEILRRRDPDCPDAFLLFGYSVMSEQPDTRPAGKSLRHFTVLGFGTQSAIFASQRALYVECEVVSVPFWAFVLLSATPVFIGVRRFFSRRLRRSLGRCLSCGYDPRASIDRCPECGNTIPAGSAPQFQSQIITEKEKTDVKANCRSEIQ